MKIRLDQLLVARQLAATREKAQAMILAGLVLVNDEPRDKPGEKYSEEVAIRLREELSRFVGRGGDKIDPLFDHFQVNLMDAVAIDVGASTGGFTDAMLQRGAKKVYAVDVGYNQLDHKLRQDPRVVVMEKTHAKDLSPAMFEPLPSFCTMDVSFISVRKILQPVLSILAPEAELLILVKPQFELGREHIGKGGVVKDEGLQHEAVRLVAEEAARLGARHSGDMPAALRGGKKGNQEYFLFLRRTSAEPVAC